MGSDNLFHKRKARNTASLARSKAKRSSYERVLIVCEGEKTEPNYFNEIIDYYKLNTANVCVDGTCGSSPNSVYEYAIKLFKIEEKKGNAFDKVYCIFDRDSHTSYDETVKNIAQHKSKGIFHSITSVPCFEYWILLHFYFTTKAYCKSSTTSIGGKVLEDLMKVMPDYEKGRVDIFNTLINHLDFAKANAQKSLDNAKSSYTDNPTTRIHELVNFLQKLKN